MRVHVSLEGMDLDDKLAQHQWDSSTDPDADHGLRCALHSTSSAEAGLKQACSKCALLYMQPLMSLRT